MMLKIEYKDLVVFKNMSNWDGEKKKSLRKSNKNIDIDINDREKRVYMLSLHVLPERESIDNFILERPPSLYGSNDDLSTGYEKLRNRQSIVISGCMFFR